MACLLLIVTKEIPFPAVRFSFLSSFLPRSDHPSNFGSCFLPSSSQFQVAFLLSTFISMSTLIHPIQRLRCTAAAVTFKIEVSCWTLLWETGVPTA